MLRHVCQTACCRHGSSSDSHLLSAGLGEGRLCLLFLGDAIGVVRICELRITRVLIASIERITLARRLDTLQEGTGLGAENILCVQVGRSHLIGASGNACEDTESLR